MHSIVVICLALFFPFLFLWGENVQLGRYEATEILRQKDIWLARRAEKEKVIESERKKRETPREREGDKGPPAPLLLPRLLHTEHHRDNNI